MTIVDPTTSSLTAATPVRALAVAPLGAAAARLRAAAPLGAATAAPQGRA